jgi:hypothetical protein
MNISRIRKIEKSLSNKSSDNIPEKSLLIGDDYILSEEEKKLMKNKKLFVYRYEGVSTKELNEWAM